MVVSRLLLAVAALAGGAVAHLLEDTIRSNLQEIANVEAKKYDCVVNIAVRGDDGLTVAVSADGESQRGLVDGTPATPLSNFAWGSVTKMVTGVTIIRLANEGHFDLDDTVAPILDRYFSAQGMNITLTGLYGELAAKITIRQLATMMAGVNDFDTAKPNETDISKSTDPFRATVYKNPTKDWSPYDLMTLPWVANGTLEFPPGSDKDYSSTNFILLGLVIAATKNVAWDDLDQASFRPPAAIAAGLLKNTQFAAKGAPSQYSKLNAFDRTSYNGHNSSQLPGTSVSEVHGVFGGWTASDIVGPVQDIADLGYAIYGPRSETSLITPENISMMVDPRQSFYGFATFLLSEFTGRPTDPTPPSVDEGTCWGHLGATYGWNSVVLFTPGNNLSISVATNIETNEQATPSDAYCVAYNRVRQILARAKGTQKGPIQDCVYDASGYFGSCVCPDTKYVCERSRYGSMCRLSAHANQSYTDCSKSCR
eukprot:m.28043 g.28043  ORF g.28043 m.28043 type:complete len:482 (-) comp6497_c0_seq1:1595-3040(-)